MRKRDDDKPNLWSLCGAALGALIFQAAPANAAEVRFPKTEPKVEMMVPDNWSVTYTDIGVELRSPEQDSVVFATVLKRDMTAVDAWKAKVLDKMGADGVSVGAAGAKTPEKTPATTHATPEQTAAAPATPSPAAPPAPDASGPTDKLPGNAAMPSFAMAGAPSVETPSLADGNAAASLTTPAIPPVGHSGKAEINGLKFQSFRLEGGVFKDKPTDIQLVLYAIPKDEFFAIEQQSGADDNRAAAILNSVKPSHH